MNKNTVRSRFLQLPATKTGWWSGGLTLLAAVMMAAKNLRVDPFGTMSEEAISFVLTVFDLTMMGCMLGGIALGVIALTRKRERSWVAWLFLLPLVVLAGGVLSLLVGRVQYARGTGPTASAPVGYVERVDGVEQVAVFFDDDGSPDGTSALLYLLSDPRADVRGVNVSFGEAHPQVYIQHLGWMLERFGYGKVPLGAGQDAPLGGGNAFPDWVRDSSDGFWGFAGASAGDAYPVEDGAALMVRTVMGSDEPVTILVSGALTTLAQALRLEPGLGGKVEAVYIMGGAVYVPGNLDDLVPEMDNVAAEWNIYADPLAASEVFASGLELYLVPLDVTNEVLLRREDTAVWRKGGSIPDFAAEIYETLMGAWGVEEVEIWDLMTAEIMMNPGHCSFTPLRLEVVTAEGATEGQTVVVEGEANVHVCLEADGEAIRQGLEEVFSGRE